MSFGGQESSAEAATSSSTSLSLTTDTGVAPSPTTTACSHPRDLDAGPLDRVCVCVCVCVFVTVFVCVCVCVCVYQQEDMTCTRIWGTHATRGARKTPRGPAVFSQSPKFGHRSWQVRPKGLCARSQGVCWRPLGTGLGHQDRGLLGCVCTFEVSNESIRA